MDFFDISYALNSTIIIAKGIPIAMAIALCGFIFGGILGFFMALCKIYRVFFLTQICVIYVSFFRATPLLVQIFLAYYGIPILLKSLHLQSSFSIDVTQIPAIYFIFVVYTLYASAYLCEIFRSSILSVDKGQLEAAYAIGMTTKQALIRIIIPQALLSALPNLLNFFIILLKESSLAFAASVPEIMGLAKIEASRSSRFLEVYVIAAGIYWVICMMLEYIFARAEKKIARHKRHFAM